MDLFKSQDFMNPPLIRFSVVSLHVPDPFYPPWAGGCLLVHRPESKPPALDIVLGCGAIASMHP